MSYTYRLCKECQGAALSADKILHTEMWIYSNRKDCNGCDLSIDVENQCIVLRRV